MNQAVISSLCALLFLTSGCGTFSRQKSMPGRDESYSYKGPGSERVQRGVFGKIYFAPDSAIPSPLESKKLSAVAKYVRNSPAVVLLLVGFAGDNGTDEFNLMLGEQRAQQVRKLLIQEGCPENSLQTLSYGAEDNSRNGADSRCVEIGVVR